MLAVNPDIGDLVCHNQVVLGIDGRLYGVADNTGPPCLHRPGIGIGQRDLLVRRLIELGLDLPEFLHLSRQCGGNADSSRYSRDELLGVQHKTQWVAERPVRRQLTDGVGR